VTWNPWRRIAELEQRNAQLEADAVIAERTVASVSHRCDLLADRYDKMREMNAQLRDALNLYRTL
jgi:hypothetical protein